MTPNPNPHASAVPAGVLRADTPSTPCGGIGAGALANPRPQPIVTETFEALRIRENGEMRHLCSKPTFAEALELGTVSSFHKDRFAVRVTDLRTGAVVLHLYVIRKGKATYRVVDHVPTRVEPHYAELLAVVRL